MITVNTNKLKAAIYASGYTLKELSERMGIAYNLFSKKVCGRSGFTVEQAFTLCLLLNLTMAEALAIFLPMKSAECQPA